MTLQDFQVVAQMIGVTGLLFTLLINYRQFRLVNQQMQEVRRSTTAQHILSLLSFIESDEIRAALNLVYTTLHKTPFTDWTEHQRQAAGKLCSSFSTAGTILQSGLVPLEFLIVGWEPTLRRCYQVLQRYVREMQKPDTSVSRSCAKLRSWKRRSVRPARRASGLARHFPESRWSI